MIKKETTTKKLNKLMAWNRKDSDYVKTIKDIEYKIVKNPITNEWHLYVDGEWSTELATVKEGKLLSICKAYNISKGA